MNIRTQISVTVTKSDGTVVVLERAVDEHVGDNPSFERGEVAAALTVARASFIETNALDGTRPL